MLRVVLLLTLLVLSSSCGDSDRAPSGAQANTSDGGQPMCIDQDDDGFGRHCEAGPDCDDNDDTRFEDCRCARMAEGCECDTDAPPVACNLTAQQLSENNLLCKTGLRYCRDGAWTECIGVAALAR